MKPNSRTLLSIGTNLFLAPKVVLDWAGFLQLQSNFATAGIEINEASRPNHSEIQLRRNVPSPLQIAISATPEQGNHVLVEGRQPALITFSYKSDLEAARKAYLQTSSQQQGVIGCDMTFRCLYETAGDHAFKELWETTLGQSEQNLNAFGRPILGGGLRFVMPSTENSPTDPAIEIKIESFLRDTRKLFVEAQFVWQMIGQSLAEFDLTERVDQVDSYIANEVVRFIQGEYRG